MSTTANIPHTPRFHTLTATLGAYLGFRFFMNTFIVTLVLCGIVLMLDAIELLRRLGNTEAETTADTIRLLLFKAPDLCLQIAPFAVLIGTMLTFTRMARRHELIALRATGLSARQFLVAPMLACLGIGLFNLFIFSPLAATTLKSYEKIQAELFPGSAQGLVTEGGRVWLKQREIDTETIIYAEAIHDQGRRLENATVFRFSNEGRFLLRLDVDTMLLQPGQWQLSNVRTITPGNISEQKDLDYLPTTLTVDMISGSFTSPNTLNVFEMPRFIQLLKETGFPTVQHELQFNRLLAMPALILVMFLLGAPFALHFSRSNSAGRLLVLGLVMGFSFFLFSNYVGAYGLSGRLSPVIAAWMPTAIAALIAFSLFVHFREEG